MLLRNSDFDRLVSERCWGWWAAAPCRRQTSHEVDETASTGAAQADLLAEHRKRTEIAVASSYLASWVTAAPLNCRHQIAWKRRHAMDVADCS